MGLMSPGDNQRHGETRVAVGCRGKYRNTQESPGATVLPVGGPDSGSILFPRGYYFQHGTHARVTSATGVQHNIDCCNDTTC